MAFINVYVSSNCSIKVRHNSLCLVGDTTVEYPLEDVNAVMIDGNCTITNHVLSSLAEHGALLYVCNDKHLPSAVVLPSHSYYKKLSILRRQLDLSVPRTKQLWQSVIQAKLTNQSLCLKHYGKEHSSVSQLISQVNSGDTNNMEAVAASRYFVLLNGKGYTRSEPCLFNSAVNYAYAVVRSMLARALVAHGFETSLGIHHCNAYNDYNLVDDLFEPYRGIIDCYVYSLIDGHDDMSTPLRYQLFGVVNVDVMVDSQVYPLSHSVELYVTSYVRAMVDGADLITPPVLIGTGVHQYE